MKNINKFITLLALSILIFPVFVFASDFKVGEQPSFTAGEKSAENLYMAGSSVVSAGSAEKDLLIAGGTALVSGTVAGDVFVAGGSVTILNQVSGDARIGGGNIIISGDISGDALIGGGQIILSGKKIGGDAIIAGGSVRMESEVGGKVKIGGGEVYINAPIKGDADIRARKLTLGPKADISGHLNYKAESPATLEAGAIVRGETNYTEIKSHTAEKKSVAAGLFTLMFIAKFLSLLVTALIIGLVFRRYSKELVRTATTNPLKEIGRGIITLIVLPIVSIILLFTIIGLPFGVLGILSFIMLIVFATIMTPIFLGALVHKWISRKSEYVINWKTILLGTIIYCILGLIPFIGWIIVCISIVTTVGAIINLEWTIYKEWK
jgi:hypothetical protein